MEMLNAACNLVSHSADCNAHLKVEIKLMHLFSNFHSILKALKSALKLQIAKIALERESVFIIYDLF